MPVCCHLAPLALALLAATTPATPAPSPGGSLTLVVDPRGLTPTSLKGVPLGEVVSPPAYGFLSWSLTELAYEPWLDFWSLGADTFVVDVAGTPYTVVLVAGRHPTVSSTGFEITPLVPWSWVDDSGRLAVSPTAALAGGQGLRVSPGELPAYLAVGLTLDNGTGQQGTGTTVKVRLPRDGGDLGGTSGFATLHAVGVDLDSPSLRLGLQRTAPEAYLLRLELSSGELVDLPIEAGDHRLGLDTTSSPGGGARAVLSVDGRVRAALHDPAPLAGGAGPLDEPRLWHAFGAPGPGPGAAEIHLDDLVFEAGSTVEPRVAMVLGSDFEDKPEGWEPVGVGPQLSAAAALTGRQGVLLPLHGEQQGHWLNVAPAALPAATLRVGLMGLDPAGLPAEGLAVLTGLDADSARGRAVFELRVAEQDGVLQIVAQAGDEARAVPLPEPQRPHVIDLQWAAASSRARDGLLRLWIDGVVAAELTQLPGDGQSLESLRLGVTGPSGSTGALALDDLWLWAPPGPVIGQLP